MCSTSGAAPDGKLASGTGKRTLKVTVAKKYRGALKRKLRTKAQRRVGSKLTVHITVTNAFGQVTQSTQTIKVRG